LRAAAPTPDGDDIDPDISLKKALDYYTELLEKPVIELTDAEKRYIGNSSATLKKLVVIGRDIADKTEKLENLGAAAFADENEASCQLATEEGTRKKEEKAEKAGNAKNFKILGATTFADEKQAREMIARAKEAACQPATEEEARKQEEKAEKARKKNARRKASKNKKQAALALVVLVSERCHRPPGALAWCRWVP
jgi:septal ring factor EnvC (AmiA/AmiB activator)